MVLNIKIASVAFFNINWDWSLVVNSIDSFEQDVNSQINFLKEFVIRKPISKIKANKKDFLW